MGFFYHNGKLYYNLMEFARDYELTYEGLRYALRSIGSKRQYMAYLNDNPKFESYLIDRYKKGRAAR